MAEKDMDSQDRRMMRHEKEQDRNIKKATSKYEKLVKQSDKALDLYGGTSKAYKKLKEKEKDAFRNMLDATKYMNKADRNTPSSRKIARQSKETATEKDMDVSISGQHPGTTKRKGGFASGGSVKNYAYGGRVAAMSAEKS